MSNLYEFPKHAAFGRTIAKSKIYENSRPASKVKELFTRQVDKIIWAYKLSPETINLKASEKVREIQIFTLILKSGELAPEVLQTIDKAIPSPIIFQSVYNGRTKYMAAYKRPNEADTSKWVVSNYFETEWMDSSLEKNELPVALNMGTLYQALLKSLSPVSFRKEETLDETVARMDKLRLKEKQALKLKGRIKKEKQFNRRVELNRSLNELKQEIEELAGV